MSGPVENRRHSRVLIWLTLAVLAAPYFIFFLGWLKLIYGLVLAAGMLASIYQTAGDPGIAARLPPWAERRGTYVMTTLLVLIWVWLSGAGGFNYQTPDYYMHNGRLKDLLEYSWPLFYAGDKPLVYYSAYYLPNALVGRFTSYTFAFHLMFLWTALLVLLAMLWTFAAIGRASAWIVLAFVLFSSMDIIGVSLFGFGSDPIDHAEWWTFDELYLAYQSFTFQLFWAPHQVIVSWILAAMITCAVINRSAKSTMFIGSLAFFWAPFAAVVMAPLVAVSILVRGWTAGIKEALSVQNVYGGVILLALFASYYLAGSAATNPLGWLWQRLDFTEPNTVPALILFYAIELGILVPLCWTHLRQMPPPLRALVMTAVSILVILPMGYYGIWNDVVTRGAVPCLWLLFFLSQTLLFDAHTQEPATGVRKALLVAVLAVGAATPMVSLREAVTHLGPMMLKPVSAPDYALASQFLGSTDSFFYRHLALRRSGGEDRNIQRGP